LFRIPGIGESGISCSCVVGCGVAQLKRSWSVAPTMSRNAARITCSVVRRCWPSIISAVSSCMPKTRV
jgi:hypothetical protein